VPEIVFVGTGDAFGSGGRRNSAILVRENGQTLLLDCGPTTLGGLRTLGIDPLEIDAVAISHYHGDHIGGLPFLLLDYLYEDRRHKPLHVLGPPDIESRLAQVVSAFEYEPERERTYELHFSRFAPGRAIPAAGFAVEPLPAFHHPNTRPHMLRVIAGGQQIFFTGDTGWHEALPRHVGQADLFISECVMLEESFEYHLSHERLDAERARFQAERTILTHLGSEVLDNVGKTRFELAYDGLTLEI
jgi:ribonuclease BN (tRNA processing enzyme)